MAASLLRSRENPKIGWRVDPDMSGVSEVRSFRVLTWTEYLSGPLQSCQAGIGHSAHASQMAAFVQMRRDHHNAVCDPPELARLQYR